MQRHQLMSAWASARHYLPPDCCFTPGFSSAPVDSSSSARPPNRWLPAARLAHNAGDQSPLELTIPDKAASVLEPTASRPCSTVAAEVDPKSDHKIRQYGAYTPLNQLAPHTAPRSSGSDAMPSPATISPPRYRMAVLEKLNESSTQLSECRIGIARRPRRGAEGRPVPVGPARRARCRRSSGSSSRPGRCAATAT